MIKLRILASRKCEIDAANFEALVKSLNRIEFMKEHWAKQMFNGEAKCTQLEKMKDSKQAALNC